MQKNKSILVTWIILAVILSNFFFDAPASVSAASATNTFQSIAITALSPANNQIIPSNHPLQIQLNTSASNWPSLRLMFEGGFYGLRLLNTSNQTVKWYFPLPKVIPNLPPTISNAISYNSNSHVVTVLPSDLSLGQTYAPTLAVGVGLAALVAQDLGKTYPSNTALCCTWPAQGTSKWTFQVSSQAPTSIKTATSSGGTASTLPVSIQGSNTTVQADISGKGSVTVATYGSLDPVGKPGNFKPYGGYFDVYTGVDSSLSKLVLKECNTAGTNLYYFNGSTYTLVNPAPVFAGGCLTTTLTSTSSPTPNQLTGTFFTAGIPAPTVDSLSSSQGFARGGSVLKITGTNFTDQNGNSLVQDVSFGGNALPVSNYTVLSSTTIEVWDTPGSRGTVNVQVTTSGGSSAASSASQYTYTAASPAQSIGVPAYFYPGQGTDWDKLNSASPPVKLAIINPASGPGATCNPAYAAQVNASRAAGITVIGYIYTRYANTSVDFNGSYDRTIAAVKSDIDLYYSCYPNLDGIFFDEASSSCTDASQYYAPLSAYLKNKAGKALAVLNPGNASSECFMSAADTLVTFEGEFSTYISPTYTQPAWVANYSPDRFWHLVYNVPDYSSLQSTINLSQQRNAGWVYATPLGCANNAVPPCSSTNPLNPWYALPSAGYWNDELQLVQPALPVISALSQTGGPASGGTSLTITGQNFGGATTVCFGSICLFPTTSSHPSGFNLNPARNQITLNTPPGMAGNSVDVKVTTPIGTNPANSSDLFSYAAPVNSANLVTNGTFGSGLTGWITNCKGFSGGGYAEGANCSFATSTSTSGLTLASSGNPPYEGIYQIVPATSNSILSGTVTVNSMNECGDGSVSVSVTLLDANKNPLGPTLNSDPMFGNIVLSHHPYINCAPYLFPNTGSSYFQDMPGWRAGNGPQSFSINLNSLITQNLPGITASQVAYLKIQLTNYADTTQPSVTFNNLTLSGNSNSTPAFQTLNVRDFGAVGDGVADDTTAFTNALGQLNKSGGILVVPAGTYSVQPNTLLVQSSITILGSGATLKARSAGYSLLDLKGSDIYLTGLTLDANTLVPGIVNIDPGSTRVVMTGDALQRARQPGDPSNPFYLNDVVGLQVYGNSNDILLDALTIKDIISEHPFCDSNGCTRKARGIRISPGDAATTTAKDLTIQNSYIQEVGPKEDGDCLVIQDSTDEANLSIFHNTFDRCHKRAIKIQVPGTVIGYNTINNSFQPGENFTGPGTPYSQDVFAYDMYSGISVYQNNVQVIGNTVSGIGSFYNAVELGACGTLAGVSVQNNYVHMGQTSSSVNGAALIRMFVPVSNLYIYGNTLDYALYGIVNPAGAPNTGIYTGNNIFVNVAIYDQLVNFGTPC